jgi:hypothetical protein
MDEIYVDQEVTGAGVSPCGGISPYTDLVSDGDSVCRGLCTLPALPRRSEAL